jgi:hypothetical protein
MMSVRWHPDSLNFPNNSNAWSWTQHDSQSSFFLLFSQPISIVSILKSSCYFVAVFRAADVRDIYPPKWAADVRDIYPPKFYVNSLLLPSQSYIPPYHRITYFTVLTLRVLHDYFSYFTLQPNTSSAFYFLILAHRFFCYSKQQYHVHMYTKCFEVLKGKRFIAFCQFYH